MNAPIKSSARRSFLKTSTGLVVGFSWAALIPAQSTLELPGSLKPNPKIDSWLHIESTGNVTVYPGKVEFGQGITTALQQIVADELDIDFKRVKMMPTQTNTSPNEGVTSGSQSIEYGGIALRYACAQARGTLLEKAAVQLGSSISDLSIVNGMITAPNGKSVSYGQLVEPNLLRQTANLKHSPKIPSRLKVIGQSIQRIDIPAKVSGGVAYIQDFKMAGMVHARVIRPAGPRAKLLSFDAARVKSLPGVLAVIQDGSFLAVVAEREEQAINAKNIGATLAKWELKNDLPTSMNAWYERMKSAKSEDTIHAEKKATVNPAIKTLSAEFKKPFIAHASIGPSCAIAQMKDDTLTVWTHNQGVYPLQKDLIKVFNMPAEKIVCIHAEGSGMYGHNGADDVALDAAIIAKALPNRPIRLQWMRDDEFKWEPYNSAMIIQIKASLDRDGKIVDWNHEIWSNSHSTRPGDATGNNLLASWYLEKPHTPSPVNNVPLPAGGTHRNAIPLYVFPNQKITNHLLQEVPVRISALRTLGAIGNVFALESMMDELAKVAGQDPLQFRLNHLEDQRAKDVLIQVAEMAKWDPKKLRSKKSGQLSGRGISFAKYKNLSVYVAVVADVLIDPKTGKIRVTHLFCAGDAGLIINPDGLKNQLEGGLIQAVSWTLHESIRFDQHEMKTESWAEYPILRFEELPVVEVELINRPTEKSLGSGEGTNGPAAAAIANALAHAVGNRLYELPFLPEKVKSIIS